MNLELALTLTRLSFVDLYLGRDYCDIKGLAGSDEVLQPAGEQYADDAAALRVMCDQTYEKQGEPEFSLLIGGELFRVTTMTDVYNSDVYVLRKAQATFRPVADIGLSPMLVDLVRDRSVRGSILCFGEMSVGKTSSVSSMFKERMELFGGISVAIEDPVETLLNGVHGKGRCIGVRASRKNGGYPEQLKRAVRSGADQIYIGEIRDEDTAYQVAQSGVNGHLIMSTMHGMGIIAGLERYYTFCSQRTSNAGDLMANGLAAVFWQTLEKVPRQNGPGFSTRLKSQSLVLSGEIGVSARSKIAKGHFQQLSNEIQEQAAKNVWRSGQ